MVNGEWWPHNFTVGNGHVRSLQVYRRQAEIPESFKTVYSLWFILTLRRGASLDTILAGGGIGRRREAVTLVRLKTRLIVPKVGVLKVIDTFRGQLRVENPPLAEALADGFPPAGEPADDIFLENKKRPQDQHDQRDVFNERLSCCFRSA